MCARDGRTLGVPITLLSERTRDSLLDPRAWRTPPGKTLQILLTSLIISLMAHLPLVVPSTRQGSQPHSESEVMEEERPVPSQHLMSSLLLAWPRP